MSSTASIENRTSYQACFLIPCYNHGSTVAAVIESLKSYALPIILVDDGSNHETKQHLKPLSELDDVTLVTLIENQGKGGAVKAGIERAQQLGFSHAIQIDADGQHDLEALPKLLEKSQASPTHLISGQPVYDDSVPKSRLYGRYATHIWVWIETLSFSIKDSMCGFRATRLLQRKLYSINMMLAHAWISISKYSCVCTGKVVTLILSTLVLST